MQEQNTKAMNAFCQQMREGFTGVMTADTLESFLDDHTRTLTSTADIEAMHSLSDSLRYEFAGEMTVDSVEAFIDSRTQVAA